MHFDNRLGVKNTAWAVLYYLKGYEESLPDEYVETAAWYNGREGGIVISVKKDLKRFNIAFGEHRNSDSIFVDMWEDNSSINPPTYENPEYEKAYEGRNYFNYNEINETADYIRFHIKNWISEQGK